MSAARTVRLDHLIGVYAVGSGTWSWQDEYSKLIDRPVTQQILESIRADGIREPVLLGSDGRVWDGHHRIIIAMHLGLDSVPVEFSGAVEPEWDFGVAAVTTPDAVWPISEEGAHVTAQAEPGGWIVFRRRKIAISPWERVERGGANAHRG